MSRKPKARKPGRPRWEPNEKQIVEAKVAAEAGTTQEDIAIAVLRCAPSTLYEYLRRNQNSELSEALKAGQSRGRAYVAGKLRQLIDHGNPAATIFYLKAQAGWREKQEITGADGGPIKHAIVPTVTQYLRDLAKAKARKS